MELKINEDFRKLIPDLSEEEFNELKESILSEGIREPICVWNGVIVDGHHRYNLAKRHNLDFQIKNMMFDSEDEIKIWILTNQLSRRNITTFVRAELEIEREHLHKIRAEKINELMKEKLFSSEFDKTEEAGHKKTNTREEVAKAAGVSHGYIFNVKQIKKRNPDEETLMKLRNNKITVSKVLSGLKRSEKKAKYDKALRNAAKYYKEEKDIQIINADFYPWCNKNLEDNSIDLILTDPPYSKEFLYLWTQLGEVAARVLKPNSYLITYSGQLYLDYVMRSLGNHLSYCWVICLFHTGPTQLVHARNVVCTWKPLIVYKKGKPGKFDGALVDSFTNDYREKKFHEWGQGESAVGYLMEKFSKPNALVLDPFVGGGTTLVVARDLKRKCIGIEVDTQLIDIIKSNILKPKTSKII